MPGLIGFKRDLTRFAARECAAVNLLSYRGSCPRSATKIKAALSALAELIAQHRGRSFRTYGYRRMRLWLKSRNIFRNPKTVLRIMQKYN